mgnify:CR=1 FL=1
MNNYEYIIASLPDITTGWKFGEKGPQDYIEEIVSLCSEKDRELISFLMSGYEDENLNIDFYAKALTHKDQFIREYFRFDLNVRNAKVKYLNRALGREMSKDVLTFAEDTDQAVLDVAAEEFEEAADLETILNAGDILFIDEIHRLSPVVEEYLYSAMEDFVIDIMIDKGPGARSVRISLNPFTLVGATTRSGLLTSPLRARFGITCAMEYYDTETLMNIVKRSATILKIGIDDDAAYEIALRSRGTPRIANSLLRRVRDFAQVVGNGTVDLKIARYALDALNIDKRGLDAIDNKILRTIITKFKGGPVGANTIATAVGEDQGTLEEVYEPFLIKEGFIIRTPRGREVTELAYRHLGITPDSDDPSLF